ncbi:MAG: hypothetical protein ACI3W5_02955 [Faecousia sp.]
MDKILKVIAGWIYNYSKANAGMASIRGSYETKVPEQLKSTK